MMCLPSYGRSGQGRWAIQLQGMTLTVPEFIPPTEHEQCRSKSETNRANPYFYRDWLSSAWACSGMADQRADPADRRFGADRADTSSNRGLLDGFRKTGGVQGARRH